MASVLNWNDFNLNKKAGKRDMPTSLFEGALQVVCALHKKYPNRPLQHPLAKYFLDQQCRGIGVAISEPTGIFGGACYVPYRLTGTCLDLNRPSTGLPCRTPATWVFPLNIPGAIIDVTYTKVLNNDIIMTVSYKTSLNAPVNTISSTIGWLKGKFEGTSTQMRWGVDCVESDDIRNVTNIAGFNAVRVDGLPDDCGDAKPSYPPDPPPNLVDVKGTINIVSVDDKGIVVSNRQFDYDFFSPQLSFPVNFTISGLQFNFNWEGLSDGFDSGDDGGGDNEPPPWYGNKKPFIPEQYDRQDDDEEEEEKGLEEEKLAYVVVRVTKDPDKRRIMTFSDPYLRHMFAGYFCWTTKKDGIDAQMPYETITKQSNIYKAPDGATGYRAYTINGAKITTIVYKEKG